MGILMILLGRGRLLCGAFASGTSSMSCLFPSPAAFLSDWIKALTCVAR